MVTATTGTMTFKGASGRTYAVSCYISDVIGAAITFNPNGAAVSTSPSYWIAPERVVLTDVAILTGPTVMTGFNFLSNNSIIPGSAALIAALLTSIQNRQPPVIGFNAGRQIGATQF